MLIIKIISILIILSGSFYLVAKHKLFVNTGLNKKFRLILWGIKIIAALSVLALYSYYYPKETSDIYKYYSDGQTIATKSGSFKNYSKIITGIGLDDPEISRFLLEEVDHWDRKYLKGVWNDNRSMIRFNALLYPITGGSIIALSILMAFISFLGFTLIYRGALKFTKGSYIKAIAIFAMPSVMFWSSGLLKEGLLMFNFGLLFFSTLKLRCKFSFKYLIITLLSAFLFAFIKIYVLICILPAITFLLISGKTKNLIWKFIGVHAILLILVVVSAYIFPDRNVLSIMDQKQYDFINMLENTKDVGSKVDLPSIEPNAFSIIKAAPLGFYHSFIRPHPLEYNSPLMILAGLEKLGIIVLIISSIIFFRKPDKKEIPLLYFSLSFTVLLFTVTGITTPVLGALVRYNIPAIPFLVLSVLILNRKFS